MGDVVFALVILCAIVGGRISGIRFAKIYLADRQYEIGDFYDLLMWILYSSLFLALNMNLNCMNFLQLLGTNGIFIGTTILSYKLSYWSLKEKFLLSAKSNNLISD